MTILALLIFIAPALLGTAVVVSWRATLEKIAALLVGTTVGLASFTTVVYVLTLFIPLSPALLWILCLGVLASAVVAGIRAWPAWRTLPLDRTALALLVIVSFVFANIASKLLLEKPDGLYTGIINAYGDVAWHMANITTFAANQVAPPENPIFADTRLTYPFMVNFLSALLLVGGATLSETVNVPALILLPLLVTLLYSLVFTLTGRKTAALVAVLLFLLGGATFGWTRIVDDWQKSDLSALAFITHLPNLDYSGVGVDPHGFHFLNPVTTLLLPQRSLLIGFPLAFSVLLILATTRAAGSRKTPYLLAGIMAGVIPLFHAHTTVALTPAILAWFAMEWFTSPRPKRELLSTWGAFAAAALLIGLPEMAYYVRGTTSEPGSFMRWGPRWMAGEMNLVWYWFINTGLIIPAALGGVFTHAPLRLKTLASVGLLLFVVANLWLFAPWAWDNFKIFIYFLIFCLPLISYVATEHLNRRTRPVAVGMLVLLVGFHMFSAALDLWKISLPTAATWIEWQTDEVAFAEHIKKVTKPGESIVTAPNHNSPVVVSGRPRYLGYAAHAWSHGLNPWTREAALPDFYEGRRADLPEITPDYVFVGRAETATYDVVIQPTWELVVRNGPLALYRLPP